MILCNEQEDDIIHTVGKNAMVLQSYFLLSLLEHKRTRSSLESPRLLGIIFRQKFASFLF